MQKEKNLVWNRYSYYGEKRKRIKVELHTTKWNLWSGKINVVVAHTDTHTRTHAHTLTQWHTHTMTHTVTVLTHTHTLHTHAHSRHCEWLTVTHTHTHAHTLVASWNVNKTFIQVFCPGEWQAFSGNALGCCLFLYLFFKKISWFKKMPPNKQIVLRITFL